MATGKIDYKLLHKTFYLKNSRLRLKISKEVFFTGNFFLFFEKFAMSSQVFLELKMILGKEFKCSLFTYEPHFIVFYGSFVEVCQLFTFFVRNFFNVSLRSKERLVSSSYKALFSHNLNFYPFYSMLFGYGICLSLLFEILVRFEKYGNFFFLFIVFLQKFFLFFFFFGKFKSDC
jgi:hypothetical protein